MPSLKHLNGIAQSIGHHAQSGLSWLHPHMGQACRAARVTEASIELLAEQPYPPELPRSEPLFLALGELRKRLVSLLDKYELVEEDVLSAKLTFSFRPSDDYDCSVRSTIRTRRGREFTHVIDFVSSDAPARRLTSG
jgi:hypothetical protein